MAYKLIVKYGLKNNKMKSYLLLLLLIPSTMMLAQSQPIHSVNVTGEGMVNASPDIVHISLSIENEGSDVKYLKQKNGETVAKVISILSNELPLGNFQTSHVSLQKHYDYNTKTYKYHISQGIKIKLEDISKYETLMETIFEAGVNQIDRVSFDIKNKEVLLREARSLAIDNAREKALFYAVSLDQNIGKAISISESPLHFANHEFADFATPTLKSANSDRSTLAIGNIVIEAKVNVTFELLKQ